MKSSRLLSLLALHIHALAIAAPQPVAVEKDGVLRNAEGRTLYVFAKDTGGKSTCNDPCSKSWPPFLAQQGAKALQQFSLITRDGGGVQWAYMGQPLYYFKGDTEMGEMNGEGMAGLWHVARSAAASNAPAKADPAAFNSY
jgi:predicted lipoprotein with Yx(FWY)xxD motif